MLICRDGRKLASIFMQLPSRRLLPDYYEVIQRPMDLNRIKKKIQDNRYYSLADMSEDVVLVCTNAQVLIFLYNKKIFIFEYF